MKLQNEELEFDRDDMLDDVELQVFSKLRKYAERLNHVANYEWNLVQKNDEELEFVFNHYFKDSQDLKDAIRDLRNSIDEIERILGVEF
jgi:fructose-1-phosphate kinase PfkB-like protein